MTDIPYGASEGEDSVHSGNNHQLESTLARMASYFERQEGRVNDRERDSIEVSIDVTLERFHKFRPPRFSGAGGEESTKRWIDAMNDTYKVLQYSDDRKVTFGEFQLEGPAKNWWRVIEDK